jgi:hypothetical protein
MTARYLDSQLQTAIVFRYETLLAILVLSGLSLMKLTRLHRLLILAKLRFVRHELERKSKFA